MKEKVVVRGDYSLLLFHRQLFARFDLLVVSQVHCGLGVLEEAFRVLASLALGIAAHVVGSATEIEGGLL